MKMFLTAALLFVTPFAAAQPSDPVAEIEGLWSESLDFGPQLRGELIVKRDVDSWQMQIGEETVSNTSPVAEFADGSLFSGQVAEDGEVLKGWWTQPPGPSSQAYAMPVMLQRDGAGQWRGTIVPLPQTFTFYMKILRDENGDWRAAFRNPEYNMNGGASLFSVSMNGEAISFSARGGANQREGQYDKKQELISLAWPPVPETLELTRTQSAEATGFAPRSVHKQYEYQKPKARKDGWRVAKAGHAGMDEVALSALVQSIIDADPASARPQLIHSLLVSRKGRLVLEEYFYGYDRDTPHDIRSAGKTYSSAMLGALMLEGKDISPESRITSIFAARTPLDNPDSHKAEITLGHLLTHTSGLDCNDNDDASPGNEGVMQSQSAQPDWVQYALDLPMAHAPGARYAYCTAGINLVGGALSEVSGEAIPALFDRLIAKPLQFGTYHWNLAPNGDGYLGGGAHIKPRDMLKLGQTYLDGGVWNGRRIVSKEWVEASTAAHVEINEETTGMDAETFANTSIHGADGLAWHRYPIHAGERVIKAYEANGNGGQFVIVVPEYDLAVVITGGNYGQGGIWSRWRNNIVGEQIIGAIKK